MNGSLARIPERAVSSGKRAVLYLRQSKEREDSESIETQEYLGREYCAKQGYDVVGVNVDVLSGRKWDTRPGVIETLQLIEEGRADVIVLWKWSRLSRNRLHWALASDRVALAGGRIESVTEPIDTSTASGRFARGVMTEYAAFQSESMGEIWHDALSRRVARGLLPSNGPRYGYERDGDEYRPHPIEGPLLTEIATRFASGAGVTTIARWMNESGHRSKRGKQWAHHTICATLESGFGAGLIRWQGVYHPGSHPALIPPDVWDACVARIAARKSVPRGKPLMVTGLLRCQCGHRMYRSGTRDYACGLRIRGMVSCGRPSSITLARIETYVTDWLTDLPSRIKELQDAAEKEAAQRIRSIEDRAAIERRIGSVSTKLSNLTLLLAGEKISQAAYDASAAVLNDELTSLRSRHVRTAPTPKRDLLELVPTLAAGFSDLPPSGQNAVLRQLIHHIDVLPTTRDERDEWRKRIRLVPVWADEMIAACNHE